MLALNCEFGSQLRRGKYGVIANRNQPDLIFCARKKRRLWECFSDSGNVKRTLKLKPSKTSLQLSVDSQPIHVSHENLDEKRLQLGLLTSYMSYILSWGTSDGLWLLDIINGHMVRILPRNLTHSVFFGTSRVFIEYPSEQFFKK